MPISAEDFVTNVSWEAFDELKKPELMALAQYLDLEVKHAMRKQVIKNILIDRLVEDDLLDEFDLDNKIEIEDDGADSAVKLKRLELQQEMEMAKLKLEQKRLKIEEEERKEKLQLEQEKLKIQEKERLERLAMEKEIKLKEIEARIQMEKIS